MKKSNRLASLVVSFLLVAGVILPGAAVGQTTNYWTGPTAGSWNDGPSWSLGVPVLDANAWITNSVARTITNGLTDKAWSLLFTNQNHTLLGGNLWLGSGLINVAGGNTATINSSLAGKAGLIKAGGGTLTLGNNTNLITGGITINAGTLTVPSTAPLALGNNAINLNGGVLNFGNNQFSTGVYLREFGGSSYFNSQINRLFINSLNDTTYSGVSAGVALGSTTTAGHGNGLIKTGPGTLSITGGKIQIRSDRGGLALWRGGLTVGGNASITEIGPTLYDGTLTIDDTASVLDRVVDTLTVTLGGGGNSTFRYIGNASADSAETLGDLTTPANTYGVTATIDVRPGSGRNAALTFASYGVAPRGNDSTSVDAIVNFKTGAGNTFGTDAKVLFTTVPELWNGVLMSGFVNGTDFATYHSTPTGTNGIMAFGSTGSGTSYVIPTDVNTPASTDTVLINGTTTTLGLTASTRYNALKIDGARTLDLGDYTLSIGQNSTGATTTVGLNAMIVKTGSGEAVIASTASGGLNNVDRVGSRADEYQFYVNEGVLKVTAPVLGNTYFRVNKAGPGLLWLAPVANWPGTSSGYGSGIYFSEGAIRLDPDSGAFGNQPMVLNGGVMEIEGGGTYNPTFGTGNANFRWRSSGGFAAYGADATFGSNITWAAANHIPDGAALLLNSTTADKKITLSGTLNLGTSATAMYLREIEVADNTNSVTDLAEISGQIISDTGSTPTYTYHLVKTGAGTLSLSHTNNNYSGATYVKAGTLAINGKLAAPASTEVARNPEYTAVNVMTGGTLGGTGTIDRVVRIESGGTLSPGNSTGILTIGADTSLTNGATLRLEINGLTEGTQHDQLKLTAGDLVISNSTLSLSWGTFSVSGDTNFIWIVNNTGSGNIAGTFNGLENDAVVDTVNGRTWKITYDAAYNTGLDNGHDIALYAIIPEPSALTLVGFGLLGVLVLSRRRRS